MVETESGLVPRAKLPRPETLVPGSRPYVFPPEGLTTEAAQASEMGLGNVNVLVTGSSRGIGAALARRLGYYGANVGVTSREGSREKGEGVVNEIKAAGGNAAYLAADLKDRDSGEAYVKFMQDTFGGIDVFVFNAAVTGDMLLSGLREEVWRNVMDTNVEPLYYVGRPVLRHMMGRKYEDPTLTDEYGRPVQYYRGGVMVALDSVSRKMANKGQFAYDLAKGAQHEAFRELGAEGASRGVRTFLVSCGPTDTEILGTLTEGQRTAAKEGMPLLGGKRLIEPDEIAYMVHAGIMRPATPMTSAVIEVHGGVELTK